MPILEESAEKSDEQLAQLSTAEASTSSESTVSEMKKKLTKAEKKAMYKVEFPEPMNTRRRLLKDIYIEQKDDETKQELMASVAYEIFETGPNPFTEFVNVYEVLHDAQQGKQNSLAGTFLRNFKTWLSKHPEEAEIRQNHLDEEIQARALEVFTKHHAAHIPMASEVFSFTEEDMLQSIRGRIQDFIERLHFKDALDMASHYKLQEEYTLEQFCIPCIFQDRLQVVKDYVHGHWTLIEDLFKFYDSFVPDAMYPNRVRARLEPFKEKKILTMSMERFCGKAVPDVIKQLFHFFGIDEKQASRRYAPNYDKYVRDKNIKYLLRRKFGDPTAKGHQPITDDSYVSYVKGFMVGSDIEEKKAFIQTQYIQHQVEDAIRWSLTWELGPWDIPSAVKKYMENYPEQVEAIQKKMNNSTEEVEDCSNLSLKEGYPIIIVKTWEDVQEMIAKFPGEELIGIDSEWKPLYKTTIDEVALLQIATSKEVYLVDYISLEVELNKEQWKILYEALLLGDAIKMGFDFLNDLRAMFNNSCFKDFKDFKEYEAKAKNALCIKRLVENILDQEPTFLDFSKPVKADSDTSVEGQENAVHFKLSDLCMKILNEELSKEEQCSDWAKRPLAKSQVIYAAKDAYVLLRLYDYIKTKVLDHGLDLESLIQQSLANTPKKEKTKTKKQKQPKIDDMAWAELLEKMNAATLGDKSRPTPVVEFRCLVDLMLRGLGKHLRRLGADVWLPDTKEHLLEIAKTDRDRLIISSGKAFEALRQQFPSRVIGIPSGWSPIEQLKYVVNRHNLALNKDDVFSRCIECNVAAFVVAPAPVIQALHFINVTCATVFYDGPCDHDEWREKLSTINPEEYSGHGCELITEDESSSSDWYYARCTKGKIDITRNLVEHEDEDDTAQTQIHKCPENVLQKPGRFFYVCGGCGKIYWDGPHQENYIATIADVLPPEETTEATEPTTSEADA